MRKTVIAILVLLCLCLTCAGCERGNKQLFDTTYSFDRAIISLPNGEYIEGKVDSWMDFEDGDQIQVVIDGVTYLVHSSNIVLITDKTE